MEAAEARYMTLPVVTRFPPYVRRVSGTAIELLFNEGQHLEHVTPRQALSLASHLTQAALIAMDEGPNVTIQIDWTFIESLEGFETRAYVPRGPDKQPLGKSGVTIGSGVDLGKWGAAELRRTGIAERIMVQIEPYLGLRGSTALAALNIPLVMSVEDATELTRMIQSDIVNALAAKYDAASKLPFRLLPQQAQTVIASVAFQYGDLATATPNFWRQVTRQDWKAAHANLRNFGDAYQTRRRREAEYLKDLVN